MAEPRFENVVRKLRNVAVARCRTPCRLTDALIFADAGNAPGYAIVIYAFDRRNRAKITHPERVTMRAGRKPAAKNE
jgi:hypothetical protein